MQAIEHIYITSSQRDFWMAKICLGSIRYWYPDIAITLLLDANNATFPKEELREIETIWKAGIFTVPPSCCGYWSKANAFWARAGERFLVLDADTVFLGPVLETLQAYTEDFIVEWPYKAFLKEEKIGPFAVQNHLDLKLVKKEFPHYVPPNFFFNAGAIVGRGGIIQPSDLDPFVDRTSIPTRNRYPRLFLWEDQGVLNFVLSEKARLGACTLKPHDFMRWGFAPHPLDCKLEDIRHKKGAASILHWAGPKLPFLSCLPHNDILHFYEAFYYRRIKWGSFRKWKLFWERIRNLKPDHEHRKMKEVDNRPWLRTRILASELRPQIESHFPKLVKMAGGGFLKAVSTSL